VFVGTIAGALLATAGAAAVVLRTLRAPPAPARVAVELPLLEPRAPEEVERLLAVPVEDALASLPGLQRMESLSGASGVRVMLSLERLADASATRAEIRARLAGALGRLPVDSAKVAVETVAATVPVRWTLASAALTPFELAELERRAAREVSAVAGVVRVESCGPVPEWQAVVDPARAAALGLTAGDVWRALAAPGAPRTLSAERLRDTPIDIAGRRVGLAEVARIERTASAGGCRAPGQQSALETGTAWLAATAAATAGPAIEARLRSLALPATATLEIVAPMPGARSLRLRVAGPDLDEFDRIATRLRRALEADPAVHAFPARPPGKLALRALRRDRLAELGIAPAEASEALALAGEGLDIGEVEEGEGTTAVRLRWGGEGPDAPAVLLRARGGSAVPFGMVIEEQVVLDRPILRDAREHAVELQIEVRSGAERDRRHALDLVTVTPIPVGYRVYRVDDPKEPGGLLDEARR